jgi:hypothetical protein
MSKKKEIIHKSWVSWQRVFNNYDGMDLSAKKIKENKEKIEQLLDGYLSIYKQYSNTFKHYSLEFKWSVDTYNNKDFDLAVDLRIVQPLFKAEPIGPGGQIIVPDRVIKTPPPPAQPPSP